MSVRSVTWEQTRAFRLARMHLADPLGPRSLDRIVRNLGGVHAQVSSAGELQCAVRARGLKPGTIERALWERRTLVKTWAMRGTLHWIHADDLAVWAAAFATRQHWRKPVWLRAFHLDIADIEAVVDAAADALDERPLTRNALADQIHKLLKSDVVDERIRSGWGELLKIVALHGLLCFGPNQGRNVTFVRPDRWLKGWRRIETEEAIAEVCRRYLASHGPATREEFARWWGFFPPQAGRVLESLGDEIERVDRDDDKAFILRRDAAALSNAEEDDRVRILGMFDAYTLAGLPHDAIVPRSNKDLVYRKGAWVSQVVLRGGRIVGTWTHERKQRGTAVAVALFTRGAASRNSIMECLETLVPFIGEVESMKLK